MKKFLSLLLPVLLAVSFAVPVSAAENVVDDGVQENAMAAYDELMTSFATTYSNSGEKIYPDYYGGSYINDAGQLVVYVTDNVQRPAVLSDNSDVVYEPCTYAYNELLSVMDTLNNYMMLLQAISMSLVFMIQKTELLLNWIICLMKV